MAWKLLSMVCDGQPARPVRRVRPARRVGPARRPNGPLGAPGSQARRPATCTWPTGPTARRVHPARRPAGPPRAPDGPQRAPRFSHFAQIQVLKSKQISCMGSSYDWIMFQLCFHYDWIMFQLCFHYVQNMYELWLYYVSILYLLLPYLIWLTWVC